MCGVVSLLTLGVVFLSVADCRAAASPLITGGPAAVLPLEAGGGGGAVGIPPAGIGGGGGGPASGGGAAASTWSKNT